MVVAKKRSAQIVQRMRDSAGLTAVVMEALIIASRNLALAGSVY
jgi:hypothetical protein